ncbi:MAG TPA: hypothetical protein VF246_11215 [Acidimicrobiia bacterium]
MTDTITDSYQGPVRVYLPDGAILTTGQAQLEIDSEVASWKGTLQVLAGTAVDGKALVVDIEIPGGGKGRAQLVPMGRQGDRAYSRIIGLDRNKPF